VIGVNRSTSKLDVLLNTMAKVIPTRIRRSPSKVVPDIDTEIVKMSRSGSGGEGDNNMHMHLRERKGLSTSSDGDTGDMVYLSFRSSSVFSGTGTIPSKPLPLPLLLGTGGGSHTDTDTETQAGGVIITDGMIRPSAGRSSLGFGSKSFASIGSKHDSNPADSSSSSSLRSKDLHLQPEARGSMGSTLGYDGYDTSTVGGSKDLRTHSTLTVDSYSNRKGEGEGESR
jgi:hypothetical protein